MKSEPFAACYAQTEWAKTEIDKLEASIREFFATNPYELRSHLDIKAREEVWHFKVQKLPPGFAISVGNILANLRDPLDNVLAILSSDIRCGRSDGVAFPFAREMKAYDSDLRKVEKLLPVGAGELIRKAETYPGGNAHLRAMHFLNRDKKHRVPIAPFNTHTMATAQALAIFKGGKLIRLGFKNGQHLYPVPPNWHLDQADPAKMPKFIPDQGFVFEAAPGDDDMEVLATSPGTQFYGHFKPALNVTFAKVPNLEREAITIALHKMRELVDGILLTFEKRFFA